MSARRPSLDAVRGIAALSVVVYHVGNVLPGMPSALGFGWAGVDLFFVLSGFLLGGQLLDQARLDAETIGAFYLRRAFRILPLYALLLLVVAAVHGLAVDPAGVGPLLVGRQPWWALAFLQNLREGTGGGDLGWLVAPTWSLAVEEHFYLLLPLALLLVPRRLVPRVALGVVAFCAVARFYALAAYGPAGVYYLTTSRLDAPAVGVALAWWVRHRRTPSESVCLQAAASALCILAAASRFSGHDAMYAPLGYLVTIVGASGLVLASVAGGRAEDALGKSAALRWIGARAYAVYLAHYPLLKLGIAAANALGATSSRPRAIACIAGAALTFPLAALLYRFVEEPASGFGRGLVGRWLAGRRNGPTDFCRFLPISAERAER